MFANTLSFLPLAIHLYFSANARPRAHLVNKYSPRVCARNSFRDLRLYIYTGEGRRGDTYKSKKCEYTGASSNVPRASFLSAREGAWPFTAYITRLCLLTVKLARGIQTLTVYMEGKLILRFWRAPFWNWISPREDTLAVEWHSSYTSSSFTPLEVRWCWY